MIDGRWPIKLVFSAIVHRQSTIFWLKSLNRQERRKSHLEVLPVFWAVGSGNDRWPMAD
jgi:hypothetical protein